jgi:hypothetical protein
MKLDDVPPKNEELEKLDRDSSMILVSFSSHGNQDGFCYLAAKSILSVHCVAPV